MKHLKWLAMVLVLIVSATSGPAWADRGFRQHGQSFGKQHFRGHPQHFRGHPQQFRHQPFRHHRGHARLGIFFAVPLVSAPPVIAVPASPPVYIEQADGPAASGYWYYCDNPQGYFPYVKACPGGWQKVVPQPPPY